MLLLLPLLQQQEIENLPEIDGLKKMRDLGLIDELTADMIISQEEQSSRNSSCGGGGSKISISFTPSASFMCLYA